MRIYFSKCISKTISITFFLIPSIFLNVNSSKAEDSYIQDLEIDSSIEIDSSMEIDSSTKTGENNSDLPTNPFEIVEMIRRVNSLNDATKPSDAIDDALESFYVEEENKI